MGEEKFTAREIAIHNATRIRAMVIVEEAGSWAEAAIKSADPTIAAAIQRMCEGIGMKISDLLPVAKLTEEDVTIRPLPYPGIPVLKTTPGGNLDPSMLVDAEKP